MWPQTDPRLTYEIVEEKHWYIDDFGDLIEVDALAGKVTFAENKYRYEKRLLQHPFPANDLSEKPFWHNGKFALDKSGHYSYPIAL
jgi:hypothetical protein